MSFFKNIFGGGKASTIELSRQKSAPKPPLRAPHATVSGTHTHLRSAVQDTLQGGAMAVHQRTALQERVLDLPDFTQEDLEDLTMQEYLAWAQKTARLTAEMKRAPGSTYEVFAHLKKGGIIYLDPLGVYFSPTSFYRRSQGTTRTDVPDFIVDASDLRDPYLAKQFVENSVRLINDSASAPPLVIPDSSDRVDPLSRGG